jgi:hypothetical protein
MFSLLAVLLLYWAHYCGSSLCKSYADPLWHIFLQCGEQQNSNPGKPTSHPQNKNMESKLTRNKNKKPTQMKDAKNTI